MSDATPLTPHAIAGDLWRFPADCRPAPSFPGCVMVTPPTTGAQFTARVTRAGRRSHQLAPAWFRTRVRITPVGDGEPDGEPFLGWATSREPLTGDLS